MNENIKNTFKDRKKLLRFALPLIILILAVFIGGKVAKKKPKIKRKTPQKLSVLVETKVLTPIEENICISAMGTVIPAKQVTLNPLVSGEIIQIAENFSQGSLLKQGDIIAQIDTKDYEIQLKLEDAKFKKAKASLNLENGRQIVAKKEWEFMKKHKNWEDKDSDNALALRTPQLNQAKSDLESIKASYEKAELNLNRTTIKIPFDGIISKRFADIGSIVSPQSKIAEIVYSNEFWVEVLIPQEKLSWINIPQINSKEGSNVKVYSSTNKKSFKNGKVTRLLKEIEENGRMAKLLISILEPLKSENGSLPLLLNSYVNVEIEGKKIKNAFKIPRDSFRENNTIWIADKNMILDILPVTVIWKDEDMVYIKCNKNSFELIITDLTLPIKGMPLSKFNNNKSKKTQEIKKKKMKEPVKK